MNCIFPNNMVDAMTMYEVDLGLFALQTHDWLVAPVELITSARVRATSSLLFQNERLGL